MIDLTREVIDLTRDREVIDVDKSEVENEQQETADKEATRQQQAGQEAAADLFASSKAQSEAAATKTNEADVRAVKEVEEAERLDGCELGWLDGATSTERVEALRSLLASFRKAKYSEAAATKPLAKVLIGNHCRHNPQTTRVEIIYLTHKVVTQNREATHTVIIVFMG